MYARNLHQMYAVKNLSYQKKVIFRIYRRILLELRQMHAAKNLSSADDKCHPNFVIERREILVFSNKSAVGVSKILVSQWQVSQHAFFPHIDTCRRHMLTLAWILVVHTEPNPKNITTFNIQLRSPRSDTWSLPLCHRETNWTCVDTSDDSSRAHCSNL